MAESSKGNRLAEAAPLTTLTSTRVGAGDAAVEEVLIEEVLEMLRPWASWRVCGEEKLVLREDVSLWSQVVGHLEPGGWVQQAGPAKRLLDTPTRGLIRMPVRQLQEVAGSWATVDARALGGPRYLEPAPQWEVVYQSNSPYGDVVLRQALALDSDVVAILSLGDVVEQLGPPQEQDGTSTTAGGILRMHVSLVPGGRGAAAHKTPELNATAPANDPCCWATPCPTAGWVTVDATRASGPRFLKPRPVGGI